MSVVIENPVLDSPFAEPTRHFKFSDEGITDEIVPARRVSSYFIPIPRPKQRNKAGQLAFDMQWTQERIKENDFINRVRERASLWCRGGYVGVTTRTKELLAYWQRPEGERRLFFCQIEALETAIYITEVANKYGDTWIENQLREFNRDANPLLGVRAFGTQLLCEQVVGRDLRRTSYSTSNVKINVDGAEVEFEGFAPEYAKVYGVPFSFIPSAGSSVDPKPGPTPTRVRALKDRAACEITFPRVIGYRYQIPTQELKYTFTHDSKFSLSTRDIPTKTENAPIVGETAIHTLDDLKKRREQEVAFFLAKLVLEKYFRTDGEKREGHNDSEKFSAHRFDSDVQAWLFPQVLTIAKKWLNECVTYKDNTFPQLLLLIEFAHDAADRIYRAIVASDAGNATLKPILPLDSRLQQSRRLWTLGISGNHGPVGHTKYAARVFARWANRSPAGHSALND